MTRRTILAAGVAALALAAPAVAVTGGSLDGAAHPAVGLLLADRGAGPEPECSGSLVSPTVFVTAAHCVATLASDRVWVSFDSRYVAGSSPLDAGTAHADPLYGTSKTDSHDVAVVVLDAPVTGVAPLALPKQAALDAPGFRSQNVTNVGYGYSDRTFTFDGYRRWSTSRVSNVQPTELMLADQPGGVCYGDSGGPQLAGDVEVAITSSGNRACAGQSWAYRLDTPSARAFLSGYLSLP